VSLPNPQPEGLEARGEECIAFATCADLKSVMVDLLSEGEHRELVAGLLGDALQGSIRSLGYPVGMGLTISDADADRAAKKLLDRLVGLIAAAAAAKTESAAA
jgi:hypothetical protein